MALVVVAALGAGPARAGVTTSVAFHQEAGFGFNIYDPTSGAQRYGQIAVFTDAGETSTGPTVVPSTSFKAYAYVQDCNWYSCTFTLFNTQVVTPTALSMDPIGNSATISACLVPTTGGSCHNFNLSLTKPQSLQPQICATVVCLSQNAYVAPDGSSAGASAYEWIGLYRYGYTVSGTFDNAAFVPPVPPYGNYGAGTFESLSLGASVVAP